MQSMVEILIHAAFITSILLQPIASSDDIIFYDEFLFHFDLLNENDWDQYHVQNNKPQETQNTFDYHGRRLIGQHNQHNDNDNQYASKCTNRIPVIFKHLCVHWDLINGFTFNYRSTLPQSTQNNYQTNWFYPSRSAKISSAKNAAKYYNILDGETWSMSDDKSWNEIDWISSLNHETPSDDVFKQCRTNKAIEECAHYDLHHKKLTFAIKVPKGRYKRHTPSHHLSSPANIESFAAFAPQSIAMPFDIGSLGIDSNALFPPRGDFESIKGPMDGLDMSNMNAPPFADNQVFTNDLRDETASRMMQMIGFNDPMNVRRRMHEDDEDDYMDDIQNGYDFTAPFEYGDMLGYRLWAKDRMAVDEFECLNCDEENVFGAHAMDDETEIEASDYSLYGDFMYYFDEHLFDFANDEDWKSNNGDLSKCSVAIPGLHHKLCVDHDNGEYQVRFAAASSDEMDDTYYQLYGYDEYYYNNVLDDYADYTTDHDYAYDESDSGYYEEAMRQISQRRQLSSEEEFDEVFEVPRGYDEEEYGDGNNGYDEQHAMQGVAEERAEARRAYLDEMSAREEKRKKDKEAEFERLKKLETQEREKEEGETLYTPPHPYAPPHPGVNPQQTMYQQPPQHPGAKPQPIMYQQHPQAPQWQQRRRALYDYDYAYDGIDDEYHTTNDEDEYTDYFSEYYGMNDEDNYYYIQQDMQAHELLDHLQSELGDLLLSLEDNTNWDEITDINDHEDALHHTQHSLRKCKTLQSVQICATMHHNDAITDGVKVNLKVGRHKYHRSPFYQSAAYQDMMDEMREFNRDDATEEEFDYDMNIDKAAKNTLQDMHWAVDHNIMDVAEDEWNDPLQFKPSHHMTYNGHQIIRKCKATFCLCQYINNAYEGTQIHPCKPTIKADKAEILGPADLLNLVNVMDSFLAPVHVVRRIPTINIIHHPMIPPPVTFNGVPMLQRLPYAHILRLRAIPPRSMFIHPFRGRKFQNPITYRRHKHRIPWHKYQPFAKLMPPKKPQWLPQWIWQEVRHKMTQSIKPKAANKEMEDYYDYDEHLADYYDDLDNKQGQGTRRASSYERYSGGDDDDYAGNDEGGDNNNRASDDDDDQYDAYYDDYDANNPPPKYSDDDSQLYNNAMDGEFMDNALNYRRLIGDYYDYDEEDEDADREEEDEIMDGWIDEYDGDEWVIVDDGADSFVEDNFGFLDYEDDSIWDEIMMNIETLKGKPLAKKCMNIFGRTLCICEFMDWLNGKIIGGNTKHICYSSAHKESAITKKTMKQIQTVAKQKRKAKESKALKQEVVLGKALQKEQKEVQSLKKKETETKEQNKDLKKKEVHLKKEIQAKQKKENKAKEQNKELKKKEQHLKKEIETKKQKEVKAKEQNKDLKKKEQHLKKEIQTEKHKETKAKKETKQLKKKEDDLKKTLKKKIVQQKKKETVLEKELQKKVVQQKTSVHKKQVIEKNIVLKKTEKPVSPKHKALQKERDDLKKEIAKTVQEHSELKQKNKKIAVNTLRLNRMAQTKVTKGHQHIMKEHHVLMKQMKQLHHLMKKVRSQKNAALPHRRPIWLPHYFWHWLHHFPHFHELHLRHKMPWISSAAHIDEDEEHAFNGGMEMDDNDYAYGSEYDDAYDEWVEAAENYAKAYLEYNAALAGYDEDDAFVKAAENYAQAYLEYDDALDGFAYNGEDYDVDEMVEYILSGKEENEDYYYDDANDDDEMGTENEYVYEEENEYAYDDDKALTYDDDTDETYGYDDLYNDEYEQYTDEGDHNYDEDSEYASNMDDYYVGEDGMSAWTMDDNDYHNDVNEEYDEFEYEYESHSDYSDAEDEESDEDGDALIAALAQSANDGTNPYWVFELIFLALCGFGVICAVIYVQKQEWIETIREMNRQRINSRKYGFNRINVVFDTEDTGSDDSDWGHHVPIANKMMDMDHDLSGDEHLGSSHESPINESEIHNMIQ
eukprot:1024626_1